MTKTIKSLRLEKAVDRITLDVTNIDGEPIVTVITTTLSGTKWERFTVIQFNKSEVKKLTEFLNKNVK